MGMLIRILIAAVLLALAPASPTFAQNYERSAAQAAEIDALFARLSASTDEPNARSIADQIWTLWTKPDDPVLAERIAEIIKASGFAGPGSQLPLIDALVEDYPDYSEAWNLRATAHFLRGDNEAALSDVEETLNLEPRHFGALAGRALILHNEGRQEEALAAIRAALEIHPFLPERTLFPELVPPPIRS